MHVFPVCSPTVARRLRRPADLLDQRLYVDESMYDEWPRWFDAAGVEYRPVERKYLDDDTMLVQAAVSGQGIVLARTVIAQGDLDAGRLVRPFDISILSAFQYHFVCPPERLEEPRIKAFHEWLSHELR